MLVCLTMTSGIKITFNYQRVILFECQALHFLAFVPENSKDVTNLFNINPIEVIMMGNLLSWDLELGEIREKINWYY